MSAAAARAALRRRAIARSFAPAPDVATAVAALGFVQYDPIRAPARAQDLILRQRVRDYRVGDLERAYATLPLAEDMLHVYGVLPAATAALLHPRRRDLRWRVERERPELSRHILAHIDRHGPTHPRELQAALGRGRIVNGWGGQSAATTRMLELLHHRGLLRVARRDNGIRVYERAPARPAAPPVGERADRMIELLVRLYAPLPRATLVELVRMLQDGLSDAARRAALARCLKDGRLARAEVDGITYLWPADEPTGAQADEPVAPAARLLAPFDPLVWDRRRFGHLWQWEYRFEAYTPAPRRRYGYYALPLLWGERIVGWANAAVAAGRLALDCGFAGAPPRGAAFRQAVAREAEAFARALGVSAVELRWP